MLYLFLLILLVGVLFTNPINGARSWYKIGDFLSFQPSELGKIFFIMFLSLVLYRLQLKGKNVVPREKPHTGAAAREQPRASPVIAT